MVKVYLVSIYKQIDFMKIKMICKKTFTKISLKILLITKKWKIKKLISWIVAL